MPRITPWLSGSEKLAELPITPQLRTPRAFTAASVGEVVVGGAAAVWAKALAERRQASAVSVSEASRASVWRMGCSSGVERAVGASAREALVDLVGRVVEMGRDAHALAARRHADVACGQPLPRRLAVGAANDEDAGVLRRRRDEVEAARGRACDQVVAEIAHPRGAPLAQPMRSKKSSVASSP